MQNGSYLAGLLKKGLDRVTGRVLIEVSAAFHRLTHVVNLLGDPTKVKTVLGWNPRKTSYEELTAITARHGFELARREKAAR